MIEIPKSPSMMNLVGVLVLLHMHVVNVNSVPVPDPNLSTYNGRPVVYMSAFYDPKYHDDGREKVQDPGPLASQNVPKFANQRSGTEVQYTPQEKKAIVQKYNQMLKHKRGIAQSRNGFEDSLALESNAVKTNDNQAVESNLKPKQNDQIQTESHSNPNSQPQANQIQVQPHHDYGHYHHSGHLANALDQVEQFKDELVNGRRKFKTYYFKPNYKPSFGKAFLEMESHIGYWK